MLPRLGGPALPRLLPPLLLLLLGAGVSAEVLFRCPPCTAGRVAACETTPAGAGTPCAELVREPGCGCCLTCALRAGQLCGVYTERCGAGLRCHPKPGEQRPLQALLDGRGVCANASAAGHLRAYPLPAPGDPTAPGEPPAHGEPPQWPGLGMGGAAVGTPLLSAPQRLFVGKLRRCEARALAQRSLRSLSLLLSAEGL